MNYQKIQNNLQGQLQHPPKYMHRLHSHRAHPSSILLTPEIILLRQQMGMDMEGSRAALDL